MNTEQIKNLIESYQKKIIQLAERLETGLSVDPDLVSNIALSIKDLRKMLK